MERVIPVPGCTALGREVRDTNSDLAADEKHAAQSLNVPQVQRAAHTPALHSDILLLAVPT